MREFGRYNLNRGAKEIGRQNSDGYENARIGENKNFFKKSFVQDKPTQYKIGRGEWSINSEPSAECLFQNHELNMEAGWVYTYILRA